MTPNKEQMEQMEQMERMDEIGWWWDDSSLGERESLFKDKLLHSDELERWFGDISDESQETIYKYFETHGLPSKE